MRQILANITRLSTFRLLIGGGLAAVALSAVGPAPLAADEHRTPLVVVELFTSQGCSSCPPADALMGELSDRKDVLPLSLHVDYWDYIGWRDAFAQPQFTTRQKAYAHVAGKRTIYTPQMVVQGADHLVGTKPMRLADLIQRHRESGAVPVSLSLRRNGDHLSVEAIPTGSIGTLPPVMRFQLVQFDPHERVAISRGENAGRVVDYTNVVTEMRPLVDWNGKTPVMVDTRVDGDGDAAVILQVVTPRGPGPILAAARAKP